MSSGCGARLQIIRLHNLQPTSLSSFNSENRIGNSCYIKLKILHSKSISIRLIRPKRPIDQFPRSRIKDLSSGHIRTERRKLISPFLNRLTLIISPEKQRYAAEKIKIWIEMRIDLFLTTIH